MSTAASFSDSVATGLLPEGSSSAGKRRLRLGFDVQPGRPVKPDAHLDRTDIATQPLRINLDLRIETGRVAHSRATRLASLLGLASV